LEGVMGVQQVQDLTLIRHAYVRAGSRNRGTGGRFTLVQKSCLIYEKLAQGPVLIGTWADAIGRSAFTKSTAVTSFVPSRRTAFSGGTGRCRKRQVEASMVLADPAWPELG